MARTYMEGVGGEEREIGGERRKKDRGERRD